MTLFVRPVGQGFRVSEVVGTFMDGDVLRMLTIDWLDHFFGSEEGAEAFIEKKFGAMNESYRIITHEEQLNWKWCGRCVRMTPHRDGKCQECK